MEQNVRFSVAPLISDHAVLQRDEVIPVRGRGRAGARVRAELEPEWVVKADGVIQPKSGWGVVNPAGTWLVELPPFAAGGPYCLRVESEREELEFHDLYFGDIWVMAGQSNMQLPMERVKYRYPEAYKKGASPMIRQFTVPIQWKFDSDSDALSGGEWKTAAAEHTPVFSAVGFFFAQKLYERYRIPVGLILTAVGGTPVQAWMSREALCDFPDERKELDACSDPGYVERIRKDDETRIAAWWRLLDERDQGIAENWAAGGGRRFWKKISLADRWDDREDLKGAGTVWLRNCVEIPPGLAGRPVRISLGTITDADCLFVNGEKTGSTSYRYPPREYETTALRPGCNQLVLRVADVHGQGGFTRGKSHRLIWENGEERDITDGWEYRRGAVMEPLREQTFFERKPAGMYQGMIAPLHRVPVKGICWYQGEMNADEYERYPGYFKRLIEDWRRKWNRAGLPVLFVQLPCYDLEDGKNWVQFREMQRKLTSVPGSAMVVSMDCGEENDLHPVSKKPVGERLAMAAFQMAYGEDGVWLSPLFSYGERTTEGMILHFNHSEGGLETLDGTAPGGFEYCFYGEYGKEDGRKVRIIPAEARVEGNTVVVPWPKRDRRPDALVYSWSNNPSGANLCNAVKLPASPFLCRIETERRN